MIYIARIGTGVAKIGYSYLPEYRLVGLANYYRQDAELLCVFKGTPIAEEKLHARFAAHRLPGRGELFRLEGDFARFVEAKRLRRPILHTYKRKSEVQRIAVIMTPERIRQVGTLLHRGMSGPEVARQMHISTASVYAHWKQVGKNKWKRKLPSRKPKKD